MDYLKYQEKSEINNFYNNIFEWGAISLITKPTRVTFSNLKRDSETERCSNPMDEQRPEKIFEKETKDLYKILKEKR